MDELQCMIACEKAVSRGMLANDKFMITVVEHCDDPNFKVIYEMSLEEVRSAFITAIQNILDALAEFARKMYVTMSSEIESKKLNDKLGELKSTLATNRAKASNTKIIMFDMIRYNRYYTEYINKYTKEIKDMASRKFTSIDEYNEWKDRVQNELNDFNLKLTDEEQWKISVSVSTAINLSEDEIKNYKANIKFAHEYGEKTIEDMRGLFKSEEELKEEDSIFHKQQNAIRRMVNNSILSFCNQIAAIVRSVINSIHKHPFATIALIVLALSSL